MCAVLFPLNKFRITWKCLMKNLLNNTSIEGTIYLYVSISWHRVCLYLSFSRHSIFLYLFLCTIYLCIFQFLITAYLSILNFLGAVYISVSCNFSFLGKVYFCTSFNFLLPMTSNMVNVGTNEYNLFIINLRNVLVAKI